MLKHDAVRQRLQDRLEQLTRRVGAIEHDLRSVHDRDSQERASELQNDEVLEGLDAMSLAEVRQIQGALRRIADGNYGACASCGRPIGAPRLAAVPTTTACVACANRSQASGAAAR